MAFWVIGLLVCLLGGVQLAYGERSKHSESQVPYGLGPGYRPPEFSGRDLKGTRQNIARYRDHVLVLHFWATWCPYCRSQIPELIELHEQWADKGVRVLTISTDQATETVRDFVKEQHLPYVVMADSDSERSIASQYAVDGVPVTYVIGRDGLILFRLRGKVPLVEVLQHVFEPQAPPSPA